MQKISNWHSISSNLSALLLQTPAGASLKDLMKSGSSCRAEPRGGSAKSETAVIGCGKKKSLKLNVSSMLNYCYTENSEQGSDFRLISVDSISIYFHVTAWGSEEI